MTFVIVNYLSSQSLFETWDVREDEVGKTKGTYLEKIFKVASLISYVPTTFTILRYLLRYRK
jgi:hypothetical protein|tara:strand:+ start:16 stop:201 length:186 start_codon:yes stop_codon:yes gene_type:complete